MNKEKTQVITDEFVEKRKIDEQSVLLSPEEVNKELIKKLKKSKIKIVEIIAKSSNNYILKKSDNADTYEKIKKVAKQIKWNGFKLGIHMLVGMPESTKIDDYNSAKDFAKLKPKIVRIYPYQIEENKKKIEYDSVILMQIVERCKECVYVFNEKGIDEIAIGMQNVGVNNNLHIGFNDFKFAELVEDSIWYDSIVNKIKKVNAKVKEVRVTVNPKNKRNVLGNQKSNIKKLKDTYEVDVLVQEDEEIKEGKSQIEILSIYED